jgi:hypothetical protein
LAPYLRVLPVRVVLWSLPGRPRLSWDPCVSFRFHALAVVLTYPRPLGRPQRLKQRPTPLLFNTTTPQTEAEKHGKETGGGAKTNESDNDGDDERRRSR